MLTGTPISDKEASTWRQVGRRSGAEPGVLPRGEDRPDATAEMFQAGQTAMQNVLTTNPKCKLVLAYASDGGNGASQAIMDEFAKGATSVVKDLARWLSSASDVRPRGATR